MIRIAVVDDKLSEAECSALRSEMGRLLEGLAMVSVSRSWAKEACDVLFVHVNNHEWSANRARLRFMLEDVGLPGAVVLTTGAAGGASEEDIRAMRPSEELRERVCGFPRALGGKEGYLELCRPLPGILAEWKPGEPFPVRRLVPGEAVSVGDLLRPFAALDVLLQGYLAIRDPDAFGEELAGLPPDTREAVVSRARDTGGRGALDAPREWFGECFAGFETDGAGSARPSWHFLDRHGELWCFAGAPDEADGTRSLRDQSRRFDRVLLEFDEAAPRDSASPDPGLVIRLLGSDALLKARGLDRPDEGSALKEMCEALSRCARGEGDGLGIPPARLPEAVAGARRALLRLGSLLAE